jgi:hypothetical protein
MLKRWEIIPACSLNWQVFVSRPDFYKFRRAIVLKEKPVFNVQDLLAKAKKPAEDAMILHPFYRGKIETALKCTVRSFDDFAIWYTPGVLRRAGRSKKTRTWCTSTRINGTRWQ